MKRKIPPTPTAQITAHGGSVPDDFGKAVFGDTLSQIPSLLGRLSYLASLRDPLTGRYRHVLLGRTLHEHGAHEVVQRAHWDVFTAWLDLNLEEHVRDFEQFLMNDAARKDPAQLTRFWVRGGLGDLIPASSIERDWFESEIVMILELALGRTLDSETR